MYNREQIKVIAFIDTFKDTHQEEVEDLFYHGHCYWFANIVAQRFHGDIWFNPTMVHFACRIGKDLYDIYGKVEPGRYVEVENGMDESFDQWVSWDEFQKDHQEAVPSIVETCIKKVRC